MAMTNWMSFMQSTQLKEAAKATELDPSDPAARVLAAFGSSSVLPVSDVLTATRLPAEQAAEAISTLRNSNHIELIEQGDTGERYLHLTSAGQAKVRLS